MDDVIGASQREADATGAWGKDHHIESVQSRLKTVDASLATTATRTCLGYCLCLGSSLRWRHHMLVKLLVLSRQIRQALMP